MKKILNQHHNKDTFIFALSRLFERASYYGLRALIVLYMIGETINLPQDKALAIYGWFTVGLVISGIIGAVIGDLLIGNKTTMIIGATLQMVGALVISAPSLYALYLGLSLIVIGGGMYSPNLMSNFGRLYLNKTKLLDSAFLMLYVTANVGAFIGILTVGMLGEKTNFNIGVLLVAVFMLISLILSVFTTEAAKDEAVKAIPITSSKFVKIVLVLILFGLFWTIYEFGGGSVFDLYRKLINISGLNYSYQYSSYLNSLFLIPIGIILVILWSRYYSKPFGKLALGFIAGSIGYGCLYFIPESPSSMHLIHFIISAFFLVLAELFVSPVIYTIITKYSNPKYLAIVMSLVFLPYRTFYFIQVFLQDNYTFISEYTLAICTVAMVVISMGLILFTIVDKNEDEMEHLDYFDAAKEP